MRKRIWLTVLIVALSLALVAAIAVISIDAYVRGVAAERILTKEQASDRKSVV